MAGTSSSRLLVASWSVLLAAAMLGPGLGPGFLLSYDMVWVPDLALRPDFLGLGSGLPRAVPSDAVVAVVDEVVPGMVLQKLVLLVALAAGGVGAARLVDDRALAVRLLAVGLYDWNVLVAERLLIGHWPVLVGYAALPWVVLAARDWRRLDRVPLRLLWLVPAASLSASAGIATAVVLLAFAAGRGRLLRPVLLILAANASWLVSGLLHASTATTATAGAQVFALQGEGSLPAPLAALSLGGIWNSEVVPDSRTGLAGWLALLLVVGLAALGLRSWRRRTDRRDQAAFLGCWALGFGIALLSWAAPSAVGWLAAHVPGAGLVRDGSRMLVLCAPLVVVLVAEGANVVWSRRPPLLLARVSLAGALVLAPVAVLPDAAWGLAGRLQPADYPAAYDAAREVVAEVTGGRDDGGDVVLLPFSSYRQPGWNHDHKVLDPLGRYLTPDYVADDALVVSGVRVTGEDPRARDVAQALALPSPADRSAALGDLGIAVATVDHEAPGEAPELAGTVLMAGPTFTVVRLPEVTPREVPTGWVAAMAVVWTAYAGLLVGALVAAAVRVRRRPRLATRE